MKLLLNFHKDCYRIVDVFERESDGSGRGLVLSANDRTVGTKIWFNTWEVVCEAYGLNELFSRNEIAFINGLLNEREQERQAIWSRFGLVSW
jgi:hypothetical protein